MSGGWLAQRERGSPAAMRALIWVTLALGRRVGRVFLYPICAYFVLFSRGTRRASADYLRRVLGRPPRLADVMRHYHSFASTVHDRVYLRAGRYANFDVRLDAPPALLADLRAGRGCILLGSHLGSFEILRAAGLAEGAPPVNMLMHVEGGEKLNSVLDALAPEAAPRVIPLGHPGRCCARRNASSGARSSASSPTAACATSASAAASSSARRRAFRSARCCSRGCCRRR